jgi:phosphatidylinositol alpha-mannosyltransferase
MNIGLVCPYNINRYGGVLQVVLALQRGLADRGHTVRIITPRLRDQDLPDQPDVIYLGTSTDVRLPVNTTTQFSSLDATKRIDAIMASENFDILHFHEPWVPLLSRQILLRSNAVNIATFHAKMSDALLTRTLIRLVNPYMKSVIKHLHVLTAVSHAGAEYAAGLTTKRIEIIPNGIDLESYRATRPQRTAVDGQSILFIGRLEGRKGVKYLLKAFQILTQTNPDVRLVIAGDGPDREKLESLAKELGLRNATFLGYVTEQVKLDLLAAASVFCSPALFGESFGIVLLESMAVGAVAVVGNNAGYAALMQGTGAISITNAEDSVEFANRLNLLLNDAKLRAVWKKWAQTYVEQFDYANIVERYEALYESALQRYGD